MHLNEFASTAEPLDMTVTAEFESLCTSAADLGIAHGSDISYRSRNIVARHHRFHFSEWGSADNQTVLLLHGGNQSCHSWDLVSLALADRYHVLALDQRGHGDSEWARDADYSSGAMAADAAAFCEALGVADPIVMGHSMGGMNTMRLTLEHPDLAKAIVLVDIGPEISEVGTEVIRTFVTENREFQGSWTTSWPRCRSTTPTAVESTSSEPSSTTCSSGSTAPTSPRWTTAPGWPTAPSTAAPATASPWKKPGASPSRCCWCGAPTPGCSPLRPLSGSPTLCPTASW